MTPGGGLYRNTEPLYGTSVTRLQNLNVLLAPFCWQNQPTGAALSRPPALLPRQMPVLVQLLVVWLSHTIAPQHCPVVHDGTADGHVQPSRMDAGCTAAGLTAGAHGKYDEFRQLPGAAQVVEDWPLGRSELMASQTLVSDLPQSPLARQHEEAP